MSDIIIYVLILLIVCLMVFLSYVCLSRSSAERSITRMMDIETEYDNNNRDKMYKTFIYTMMFLGSDMKAVCTTSRTLYMLKTKDHCPMHYMEIAVMGNEECMYHILNSLRGYYDRYGVGTEEYVVGSEYDENIDTLVIQVDDIGMYGIIIYPYVTDDEYKEWKHTTNNKVFINNHVKPNDVYKLMSQTDVIDVDAAGSTTIPFVVPRDWKTYLRLTTGVYDIDSYFGTN